MVASKTKKTVKYSYAERVIGAVSQTQQEQKKHAVHLATIRAQVRKRAEAKKDKLGPQWTKWVKRTVDKLEDQGILKSEAPGSVTFTPNAKKALSTARRDTPHTDEDAVYKRVSQAFSTRGLKRRRPRYSSASNRDDEDEEDDDEEHVLSVLKGKKARRSSGRVSTGGKKMAISKMTKAELQAELRSLQAAHAQTLSSLSSLQTTVQTSSRDHDEEMEEESDESQRLREELEAREKEIEAVRKELNDVKSRMGGEESGEGEEEGGSGMMSRLTSPEPSLAGDVSSPSHPILPNILITHPSRSPTPNPSRAPTLKPQQRPLAALGLTRTQSGSFISTFSKQPTPAPSDSGSVIGDHVGDGMEFDDFGRDGDVFGPSMSVGLITPESSPVKSRPSKESGKEKEYQDKIAALEQALIGRASEVQTLEGQILHLNTKGSSLEALVAERDVTITGYDSQISTLRAELSVCAGTLVEKDALIATQQGGLSELKELFDQRDAQTAVLETEKASHLAQLDDLNKHLEAVEGSAKVVRESLAEATRENEALVGVRGALEEEVRNANKALDALVVQRDGLEVRVQSLEEEAQARSEAFNSLTAEKSTLEETIQTLQAAQLGLNAELAAARAEKDAAMVERDLLTTDMNNLTVDIATLNAANMTLANDLATANDEKTALADRIEKLLSEVGELSAKEIGLHQNVDTLTVDLEQSRREAKELALQCATNGRMRDEYEAKWKTATVDGERLKEELANANELLVEFRDAVTSKQGEIVALESSRVEASAKIAVLQQQSTASAVTISELGLTLDETRDRLKKAQEAAGSLTTRLNETEEARTVLLAEVARAEAVQADLSLALEQKFEVAAKLEAEVGALTVSRNELQIALKSALEGQAASKTEHELTVASLDSALQSSKSHIGSLEAELSTVVAARAKQSNQLDCLDAELNAARTLLDSEVARSSSLENDLAKAIERAQASEEEVDELWKVKEVHERTIRSLGDALSKLRKMQVDCLQEVDSQIASAQSSPVPKVRPRHSVV
ncbi:hypothetical protein JAAARDRAFT_39368 [Jaapia argillacea MUCL 33604]|uniref:Uncharacterized protein n=1 Tax=Jaapia argillacea MUCL 33604 TaxID=933084 RepID=A0A067PEG5_9AGAM|nr:hypothetical protein JAAARDRAFT_39368 [Jaapia argillacea MUCL 33604]